MKISRLYLKILLSFIAVLIVAEVIVFGFMLSGKLPPPFARDVIDRVKVITMMVEREMDGIPATPAMLRGRLSPLLQLLAKGFGGRIWLTDAHSAVVGASFDGSPPVTWHHLEYADIGTPPGMQFYFFDNKKFRGVYLEAASSRHDRGWLTVHYLQRLPPPKDELWFLDGLLLLTVLGALFIIPVSRRITRPIRQLSQAAERLGQGDLCHRVPEHGDDEVAELAGKFNRMAERIQKMFLSGKELTAHVSHELRSPLARMRLSLQILLERSEEETPADIHLMWAMQEEIEGMDLLIERMLELSKLEMRVPPPLTDRLDISLLLRSKLDRLDPMLQRGRLRLAADIPATPETLCHAPAVDGLLENILNNAVKYTPQDGTIAVSLRYRENVMGITICNTHPPLEEEELAAMFQPFHRLACEEGTGSGLGLALAKQMAEMNGGTITAGNAGVGVCIDIRLPLETAPAEAPSQDI